VIPSAKVTTQTVTALIVAVVCAVALHLFTIDLDDSTINAISGAVGWVVGAVFAYLKPETRPAPSTFTAGR
jgi:hypothetical protein